MHPFILKSIGVAFNAYALIAPRKASIAAFNLFCRPTKPTIRPKEQAFLDTANVTRNHDHVLYTWGGNDTSEPYIVLAYGWAYHAGRWRHFVPQLVEAGFRVLAYDPPGHGLMPGNHMNFYINSSIITGIIKAQGSAPHGIIAHSFGGSSSMLALEKLPKDLHPQQFVMMASFSKPFAIFKEYQAALGLSERILNGMVSHATSLLGKPLETIDLADISANFGHINALIVHDPKDDVTPFAHAKRYHEQWPESQLMEAHKGGHHLGLQHLTDAIVDWASKMETVAR